MTRRNARKSKFVAVGFAMITGCGGNLSLGVGGKNVDVNVGSKSNESFKYHYDINGCDTGEQEFSNKSDYCAGLKDEERNRGCAYSARMETHKQNCG